MTSFARLTGDERFDGNRRDGASAMVADGGTMRLLSLLSAVSDSLISPGPCVVACVALIVAAYVAKHVVDNASYVKIKAKNFEGEFRPRMGTKQTKMKS